VDEAAQAAVKRVSVEGYAARLDHGAWTVEPLDPLIPAGSASSVTADIPVKPVAGAVDAVAGNDRARFEYKAAACLRLECRN
jgi:hypothetical protein